MDKTVKELAEQYGVSKQAIQYHIKKLPKEVTKFDTKNGVKILLVSAKGQEILEEMLTNKPTKEVTNFGGKDFGSIKTELELQNQENKYLKEKIVMLEEEKTEYKKQIEILNQRLDKSHALLENQQLLCAKAEKRIDELEDKQREIVEEPKKWWQIWK